MTLGQKLAGYRKLSGLTQQQLGERLNISAQAISKWEKDLSEPGLSTLRTLAELYKVSVDEMLDLESGFSDTASVNEREDGDSSRETDYLTIGFCKNCGIAVNEDNIGSKEPTVLCKACLIKKQEQERREADLARANERRATAERDLSASKRQRHRTVSLIVAGVFSVAFLIFMIVLMVNSFYAIMLPITLVGTYAVFAFVSCLFYDCIVREVVEDWFYKTIQWPGLIFTFDLDGIMWLIGMKLLFWMLGIAFGIFVALVGISLGIAIAPFVFPFLMRKEQIAIKNKEPLGDLL